MIANEGKNTVAGITSILDSVENALESMEETEEIREVMKVCVERSFGMSRFITNFADVVKIPEPQLETINLNQTVNAGKVFMENICRKRNINLHIDLSEQQPQVKIDTLLFEQVLVNIIKNAAESIENGGDIYISTTANPPILEITDNGKGICKEVEKKLFSPFFSTKPHGQGIGLLFVREVLNTPQCSFSLRPYADGLTRFRIPFT